MDFQVFIKPAGPDCNLACKYCYYRDKQSLYTDSKVGIMSDHLLEKYICDLASASAGNDVFFAWHGGEPTLAGLDFFRKVTGLQKKLIDPGKNIINGIQTNATLLDEDWCRFLADENFLVGISVDGPEEIHDKFRTYSDSKGSFLKTMKGYDLLRKFNVKTEILTVVSQVNENHPEEVYDFLRKTGTGFITFLPLVYISAGVISGMSVNSEAFGTFLVKVFDRWILQDIGKIKIQIIEEALRTSFGQDHTLCIFKKTCGGVPVIERNGDYFCCDHYVDHAHFGGNIMDRTLGEMLASRLQSDFGQAKKNTLPSYCLECEVLEMCNGECPKNRFIATPDGEAGLNYLCSGYRKFFNHIHPFAEAVAEAWKRS